MTWGEFKAAMAAAGAQDGDEIAYIDIGSEKVTPEEVKRHFDGINEVHVLRVAS